MSNFCKADGVGEEVFDEPGLAREPASEAPSQEEQAPSSGSSLALPPNVSNSEQHQEQSEIRPKGRGLSTASDSKSLGEAAQLSADSSAASLYASLIQVDERDPIIARLEAELHRCGMSHVNLQYATADRRDWEASLNTFKLAKLNGSHLSLESEADKDELSEVKESALSNK